MNNRRSFLKMLGLGAVAAPVVAKAAQAEAIPVPAVKINDGPWRSLGADHSHTFSTAPASLHTHTMSIDNYGMRVWVDWAKKTQALG